MKSDSDRQRQDRLARSADGERRAVATAVALFLGPGAGHLVRGRPWPAALWLAIVLASVLLLPWFGPQVLLLTLALHLAAALDAHLAAPVAGALPGCGRTLGYWVAFAAVAVLAVLGLRRFVAETFQVAGPSMEPTLSIGDVFVVSKLLRPIDRGDAIVYRSPTRGNRLFVHRIVAMGGDTVQVFGNVVYVNFEALARRPIPGPCSYFDGQRDPKGDILWREYPCQRFEEQVGRRVHRLVHGDQPSPLANGATVKVPANAYYVLGDNRDERGDSRVWGPVAVGNVVGRVEGIIWSRGREGVRWDRIGHALR